VWRQIRTLVIYALAAGGLLAPFWSASIAENSITVHGLKHIESYGPVVPAFSRFFSENIVWFTTGAKLVTGIGVLVSALIYFRFRAVPASRLLGILCIGAFGYHLALMNLATLVIAFFVLPAAANGT
jgi:hypothetical protein